MKKWFTALLAALVAVLALSISAPTPVSAQVNEIRIADGKGDWGFPNPYRHYPRGPGYVRMSWVFDTLIWKDAAGYIPALAQKWSYDADRMAFTFKLNPKAKWHDGQPLTAEDVAFSIDYFKKHPYEWVSVESVGRVESVDLHTVVVYLAKPYSPFISDVGGTMPVLPKHIWAKVDHPKDFDDPQAYIGSGPYVFKDFDVAQGTYLFEAFADYYQGRPLADRLIYIRSGKPLVALSTGQADLAAIQPEMVDPLKKKGLVIIEDEPGWTKKIMINHRKAPFDQVAFRQALALALDRQEIIDKAHRGFATLASYGLLAVCHDMFNPDTPVYPHDPPQARTLIESLGYAKGADGFYGKNGSTLRIELLASNITVGGESVADRDGEVVKKQLEAVGLKVELVTQEQATTDNRVKNWDFDLAVSGHGGIAGDARILNEMISSAYGAGSVNSARYDADEELNRLLAEQITEMDQDKRKAIVFKIQERYAELLPAISLYSPDSMSAFDPKKGVTWFYTKGGISKGVPISQNKMSLIK